MSVKAKSLFTRSALVGADANLIIKELEAQGFKVSPRGAGHWFVTPPGSGSPFVIALGHAKGRKNYFPIAAMSKMKSNGFRWPPPGREKEFGFPEPEPELQPSPDGKEHLAGRFVNASDEELGLTASEVQQQAADFRLQELGWIRFDNYQRSVNVGNPAIANEFSVVKAGCIYVSERKDGSLWCFDGQHRVVGARNAKVEALPALIYRGLTRAEEARLFYVLNRDRKPVSLIQLFKSRLEAKDPIAVEIQRRVTEVGYALDFQNNFHSGSIQAVRALEILHRWNVLGRTLFIVRDTWDKDRDALREDVLVGMGAIFKCFDKRVDEQRLKNKLAGVPVEKLAREVSKLRYEVGGTGRTHYARVILKLYNSGLSPANRLTPFIMPAMPPVRMDEPLAPREAE